MSWKGTFWAVTPPPLTGVAGTICKVGPDPMIPPSPSGALMMGGESTPAPPGLVVSGMTSWGGDWGLCMGGERRSSGREPAGQAGEWKERLSWKDWEISGRGEEGCM